MWNGYIIINMKYNGKGAIMNKKIFLLISTLFFITFYFTSVSAKEYTGEATVTAVESSTQKLKLSHGPIKGLMDAMEMEFKVADPAMLDDVDVGSKINFTLEEDKKGNLTILDLEVTGTSSKSVAGN